MPSYPFTAGELDESKTLIELCMHLDDGDDSDVEFGEDLLQNRVAQSSKQENRAKSRYPPRWTTSCQPYGLLR